jgi:predicted ATP-grasp superfamily ATP-dependent carboligase
VDTVVVPGPLSSPEEFCDVLAAACQRWQIAVLIPVTEPAALAVLAHRERFVRVTIPMVDLERFRAVSDKGQVLEAAAALGIATPAQYTVSGPEMVASLSREDLSYPVVVKPVRTVAGRGGEAVKVGVLHAASPGELEVRLAQVPASAFPVLLQQRIVGPGIGIFLLRWEGRIIAAFSHRRLREKPPSGGVSVYRESVPLDPDLVARSERLLEQFDWHGVAMVEYKVDAETGVPYLMEINGRFWGSLQLAVDAGVDFPRLLVELALGGDVAPVTTYRSGVRSRWWWGDVDHLLLRMLRSNTRLSLPPGSPGKMRALYEFMKLWRPGDRSEILRLSDPAPFLRETWSWLKQQ